MNDINVPRLMNTLLADLQSEAWTHGVKLVGDISTEMVVHYNEGALLTCFAQIVGQLLHCVPPGSSISVITTCEPAAEDAPSLRIQVDAPALTTDGLSAEMHLLSTLLAKEGGTFAVNADHRTWTLVVLLANARLLPAAAKPRTAIVVDDDTDTQDFLRIVLEKMGFRVISVSDGFDALLVVERYRPDVVLTDILMPNMNGIDLVSRLKQACPDIPVIVFSGYRDALIKNIAGLPDRILTKPMTRDQIINAVDSVLQAK